MTQPNSHKVLDRLLGILGSSFPQYLVYATPWARRGGDARAVETLQQIAADQKTISERIGRVLVASGGFTPTEFPMDYTDVHDLDVEYLIGMAIFYQHQDIAAIADCASDLKLAPAALPLAEEALGLAQGHLELLEELAQQPA